MKKLPLIAKRPVPLKLAYRLFGANPLVLVSTVGKRGPDVMTCAWCTPYDFDPPHLLLVIGAESLTAENILRTGIFTVTVPHLALARRAVAVGSVSGRDTDKFAAYGLTPVPGKKVRAPSVGEGVAMMECRLVERPLAKKSGIFIGRGLRAAAAPAAFKDGFWQIRHPLGKILHHLGGATFTVPAGSFTV